MIGIKHTYNQTCRPVRVKIKQMQTTLHFFLPILLQWYETYTCIKPSLEVSRSDLHNGIISSVTP